MTKTGSVVGSFRCPLSGPAGICLSGVSRLEVAMPGMNVIAIVNPQTASLVSTIPGPGQNPTACMGWAGEFITDAGTHAVYLNRRRIFDDIETPTGIWYEQRPSDTYPYWFVHVVDAATKRIYEYNDNVALAPASLGRVKALFE